MGGNMLDYKNIIIKRYALGLSFKQLAEEFHASKSGVNDFIRAFERCEKLSYPLPEGITNYAIAELVYGHAPGSNGRSAGYEQPNYEWVFQQITERKNMTLVYLWNRYQKDCIARKQSPTSIGNSVKIMPDGVKRITRQSIYRQ